MMPGEILRVGGEAGFCPGRNGAARRRWRLPRRSCGGAAAAIGLISLLLPGCSGRPQSEAPDAKVVSSVVQSEDQAVELRLTVAPSELEAGNEAVVTIEAIADARFVVTLEDYESLLRRSEHAFDWRVSGGERHSAAVLDGKRLSWRQTYSLVILLPGTYTLPAAALTYSAPVGEEGDAAAGGPTSLSTASLTLQVTAPAGVAVSEAELREVQVLDPVELPPRWSRWRWLGPLLAVGILATVAGAWILAARWLPVVRSWLQGRKGARQVRDVIVAEPPADQWALERLRALLARDDLSRGLFREFHYDLSDIVRGYIERQFGVCAPEMTTEEFLAAAAHDGRFGPELAEAVGRFLEACDLVKYAALRPARTEAEALADAARDFIERTRPVHAEVPGNGRLPRMQAVGVGS